MKKDISRLTVEKALTLLDRLRVDYKKKIPYGPTKVYLSPAEARRMHEKMSGDERRSMADFMGEEQYLKMLAELYYGKEV